MSAHGRVQIYALLKFLLDERLLFTGEPPSARCNYQRSDRLQAAKASHLKFLIVTPEIKRFSFNP
jgi:hypothetical protein